MIATEDLVKLTEQLRQADFHVGAEECIAAQNLLIALASSGRLPDDPHDLRDKLAPVFCSTPEEQENFHRHFHKWLELNLAVKHHPPATPFVRQTPAAESEHEKPTRKAVGWLSHSRLILAVVGALMIALALALYVLYAASSEELAELPTVRTVFGQVVSDNHRRLKGTSISAPAQPPVSVDDQGNFTFRYEPGEQPLVLEISSPGYQISKLTLNPAADEFLYVSLQALPPTPHKPTINPPGPGAPPPPLPRRSAEAEISDIPPVEPPKWKRVYIDSFIPLLGSVVALPFIVFGLWWAIRSYRRRSQLEKWRAGNKPQMDQLAVRGVAEHLYRGTAFRRTIQELRRHRPFAFNDLDIPLTVEATIKNGGWFKPAYSPRKITPEYLALVDRASFGDQWARQADELIKRLKKDGVYVSRYYFTGDPRACRKEDPAAPHLTLQDLGGLYPDHHLLIFSDSNGLFSTITGRPEYLALFEGWQNRALLTPVSIENWGFRERSLSKADFVVVPATRTGMAALAEAINAGVLLDIQGDGDIPREFPEMLRERPQRWLEGAEPLPAEMNKLCFQLRMFLGADGYDLLGACAVYPALSWDLTVYLGYGLLEPEQLEKKFLTLWRLPWFRHEVMPDWLRARLVSDLSPEREQEVRIALDDLLISYLDKPQEEFYLEVAPRQKQAEPLWKRAYRRVVEKARHWKSKVLLREFIEGEPENPLYEYVFLNFMSGLRPGKLAVSIPARMREKLRHLLYPQGRSVFGLRTLAALIMAAFLSLCSVAAAAYMLPVDDDIGSRFIRLLPIPLPASTPSLAGYLLTPDVGAQGGRYQVVVSTDGCREDLLEATLSAPDGSGISVAMTGTNACQLTAVLTVAVDAPPGTVSLSITKSDGAQGNVNFTVTPAGLCPKLEITPTGLRPDGLPVSLSVMVDGSLNPKLTYEWSGLSATPSLVYLGPTISLEQFIKSGAILQKDITITVKVLGLEVGCGNTAVYVIPANTSDIFDKSKPFTRVFNFETTELKKIPRNTSGNSPVDSIVKMEAIAREPKGFPANIKTYTWATTGGRILGEGSRVTLDLTGVALGAYTVQVMAERVDGKTAMQQNSIGVSSNCVKPIVLSPCPPLVMHCPSEAQSGANIVFAVDIPDGLASLGLTYNWSISAGIIVAGQGTPSITVDATGLEGQTIAAMVELGGISPACPSTSSCSITVSRQKAAPTPLSSTSTVSPLSGIPTALSATSPDGKLEAVVKGFSIGIFKLSNGILGKGIRSLCCLKDIVSLAFSSDGKLLGATSKNGQTRQWNVMTGKEVKPGSAQNSALHKKL